MNETAAGPSDDAPAPADPAAPAKDDFAPREDAPRWRYERADRSRRNQGWRRRMRHLRRRAGRPFALYVAPPVVRRLARTWRLQELRRELAERYLYGDEGCIAVLWHGRMMAAIPLFNDVDVRVLVSQSGDGELSMRVLERFGYKTLRGSTSRSGSRALREMLASLRASVKVAITPDGPRGPRHSVSRGPAFLARETGLPIVGVGFATDRAWYMNSWDRFTIPKPRARVAVAYGGPLEVPPDASDAELDGLGERLREMLQGCEREAFEALDVPLDW